MLRSILVALLLSTGLQAGELECTVERQLDREREYSSVDMERGRYSVRIEEREGAAFVSRCSFSPSAERVTCDRLKVDKVSVADITGIKKYYHLGSQSDVQVFPDLSFLENNGRGGIAFGRCRVGTP